MKIQFKKSKRFFDKTGSLVPFYKKTSLKNFNIRRFFFVYGKKKYFRADHAHKKCNQILIPVAGKIEVFILNQKKIKKKFILSLENNKYLFVPKKHWIRLKFLKEGSILLTLCDHKYDKKEYIQSIKKFLKNEM
tara:strand:+ start:228 stop:629 length:402 start_codon:yes stop_codon:yes gene_type:complete